jgi:hypothetical protein
MTHIERAVEETEAIARIRDLQLVRAWRKYREGRIGYWNSCAVQWRECRPEPVAQSAPHVKLQASSDLARWDMSSEFQHAAHANKKPWLVHYDQRLLDLETATVRTFTAQCGSPMASAFALP